MNKIYCEVSGCELPQSSSKLKAGIDFEEYLGLIERINHLERALKLIAKGTGSTSWCDSELAREALFGSIGNGEEVLK